MLRAYCTPVMDGCVEVDAAYYGAPPGWIGRLVQVQWDSHQVRLMDQQTGQLLREHLRQVRGRHRIKDEDRPKQTPLTTLQLLSRADRAGAQSLGLSGVHVNLRVPVRRRRALLVSNPIKE
jgi:hypothetical protein